MMGNVISKQHKYSGIEDEYEDHDIDRHPKQSRYSSRGRSHIYILLLTNIATFLSASGWLNFRDNAARCPTTVIQEHLAPFMDDIDRNIYIETFNDFELNVTRYSAKADDVGDEVEKNWVDLGVYGSPVVIPIDQAHFFDIERKHILLDPKLTPEAPYLGVTVKIQAQHFLHCVNLLRQGMWYNVDYYRRSKHPSWGAAGEEMFGKYSVIELHTAHCIDQLRQLLMCQTDLGVVPFLPEEQDGVLTGVAHDFARKSQCRNYKSFLDWHTKREWLGKTLPEDRFVGHDVKYFSWTGKD